MHFVLDLTGGGPGNELQTPQAIVILGGLLSATALTMMFLPAQYSLFGDRSPQAANLQEGAQAGIPQPEAQKL